jgi:hypothetical protein
VAFGRHDEQQQLPHPDPVTGPVLDVDHQAVGHLGKALHHRVELGGSEADAAPVERRIGPAGDDAAAGLVDHEPIAVTPHAGEVVEVGGPVAGPVFVTPETKRHRRHRLGQHQLALLAEDRPTVGVE